MWPDPVHRLLSTSQPTEEWAWLLSCCHQHRHQCTLQSLSPGQEAPVLTCPRIQNYSGLVSSHSSLETPWCGVCRRHSIFYLSLAQLVSIFTSAGFHRHLQIMEVGKIHGTLSKAMRYKVSNCWLFCEIKPRAKSTCHIRNTHLLAKYASRLCQLWRWTSGKKCDLFIENTSDDRKLHPDSC